MRANRLTDPVHAQGIHAADDDVYAVQRLGDVLDVIRLHAIGELALELGMEGATDSVQREALALLLNEQEALGTFT